MSEAEARPTNFIRQIIDEDLATGKHTTICTRFPPEPNGYLHIGHAKSICLNFGIAQDYQGQCNLRFDDTNPVKEDIEYVESIKNDVQWLGFHWSGDVRYSSDYFDQLHNYAVELINKGLAYVDELSADEIREYRGTLTAPGKNSPYRDRTLKRTWRCLKKCAPVVSKKVRRACVRRSIWRRRSS
jgi:glutaminyl-tRNA synthetase